nr:laccase-1 [Arenicola marina]
MASIRRIVIGWLAMALISALSAHARDAVVRPSCSPSASVCEFDFELLHRTTMVMYSGKDLEYVSPVVFRNGALYSRDRHSCDLQNVSLSTADADGVATGDGSFKTTVLYNGQLPGPTVVVYAGQEVVVRLTNSLVSEATTLHFHGVHQRDTPWMDGAGYISHCPINPGETFTYRFKAHPVGTHWYHSHYGTQRTMGAFGAFVVLDRDPDESIKRRGADPLPVMEAEFLLTVTDWFPSPSGDILDLVRREAVSFSYGFGVDKEMCFNSTKQADGVDCGVIPFVSGVINGKGQQYDRATGKSKQEVPLEIFTVTQGRKYLFRAICASMTFGFRLSIDGHTLHVVASDGSDVITRPVESLVVFSGERYDFWIEANDPDDSGSYWIRAETLERMQNGQTIRPGQVKAILRYASTSITDLPASRRVECSAETKCDVLNCPFLLTSRNTDLWNCIPVSELRETSDQITWSEDDPGGFHEMFLNFHFAKFGHTWKTTINGIINLLPAAPPQVYPDPALQHVTDCDEMLESCVRESCHCTHHQVVPLGSVVQMTLATTVQNPAGVLNGNSHPIHLHGYNFQVVKTGFPEYNPDNNYFLSSNDDLECVPGSNSCNLVTWRNATWSGGHVPGLIRQGAPLKDTVSVPVGGYVVVRFKADNPGFWFLHCHTEFHNEEGMSLFLQVGSTSDMNKPPDNLHQCGNFELSKEEFEDLLHGPVSQGDPEVMLLPSCSNDVITFQLMAIVLFVLAIMSVALNLYLWCQWRPKRGYVYLSPTLNN